MTAANSIAPRTALFMPASNPRAIEKARQLDADMILLDLEDAVKDAGKDAARSAAVDAAATGFGESLCAIRMNGVGHPAHDRDVAAIRGSAADFAVLPKAETVESVTAIQRAVGKPLLVMIETPVGVLNASAIAAISDVAGLIAGTNDLRAELKIPASADRTGLSLALQAIVLAARAHGCWALDGVFNALGDPQGLAEECRAGRDMGFDGKTLIHPNQLAVATEAFGPTAAELEEARGLIAAATGGAERFRDRMIEAMHVEQARQMLARQTR